MRYADIETKHLLALRAVATYGTFGRAATELGYTQSAISQQIGALERTIGKPLFTRPGGPRPVVLTDTGEIVLRHADKAIEALRSIETDLHEADASHGTVLRVGSFQSIAVMLMPPAIAYMRAERPSLQVAPREFVMESELVEELRRGELDIGFVTGPVPDDLVGFELLADPYVLLAPPDSGLKATFKLAGLDRQPMVMEVGDCCTGVIDALADGKIEPEVVFRAQDNATMQAMVRAGVGMSIMPLLAVDLGDPDVEILNLHDQIEPRVISIVRLAHAPLTSSMELCIEAAATAAVPLRRRLARFERGGN